MAFVKAKGSVCSGEMDRWAEVELLDCGAFRVLPNLYNIGGNSYLLAGKDGEGMMVASDLGDVEGVERWIERARAAYPRRVDLIATFAERAWRSMGEHARAADALRSMRLGGPFVTAETRTAVDDLILHLDAEAAGSQPDTSPP